MLCLLAVRGMLGKQRESVLVKINHAIKVDGCMRSSASSRRELVGSVGLSWSGRCSAFLQSLEISKS